MSSGSYWILEVWSLRRSLHPLAHLGLARAYTAAGNIGEARTADEVLFGIWKDANPTLSLLKEARAEDQRLP